MLAAICGTSPFVAEVFAGMISAGGLLVATLLATEVWSRTLGR